MTGQFPRLRHHVRVRASGKVVTYYFYDGRPGPDIPLGTDYDEAVKRWREIHEHAPRIAGTLEEAFTAWEREVLPTYRDVTRAGYAKNLRTLRPVFGPATWDSVSMKDLKDYLKARTGKTQANREMSLLSAIWNWARTEGYTESVWPAAGMARSRWKNKESARKVVPSWAAVMAIHAAGDQVVKDCIDIATATAMRLTDCRTVALPSGDILHLKASKTGKEADFDVSLSAVLPDLVRRRRSLKARHVMLLSTEDGRPVSAKMLWERWSAARDKAALAATASGNAALADEIATVWNRDMRKVASNSTGSLAIATELLQHGNQATTAAHYPVRTKMRPAR